MIPKHLAGQHNQKTHGKSRNFGFYQKALRVLTEALDDNNLKASISITPTDDESYGIKFDKTGNEIGIYRQSIDIYGNSGFDVTVEANDEDTSDLIYTIIRLPDLAKSLGGSWLNLDGEVPVDIVAAIWPTSTLYHRIDAFSMEGVSLKMVLNTLIPDPAENKEVYHALKANYPDLTDYGTLKAQEAGQLDWPDHPGNLVQDFINQQGKSGHRFYYDLPLYNKDE